MAGAVASPSAAEVRVVITQRIVSSMQMMVLQDVGVFGIPRSLGIESGHYISTCEVTKAFGVWAMELEVWGVGLYKRGYGLW